jgi:hypothetical protein
MARLALGIGGEMERRRHAEGGVGEVEGQPGADVLAAARSDRYSVVYG